MTQFKGVCIGRKDKNGSPIFEGDYLRCCNGKTYRVVWRDNVLAFGIQCVDDDTWDIWDKYLSHEWERL